MSYNGRQNFVRIGCAALMMLAALPAQTQFRQEPGRSIGTVTTQGNLIVLTLNEDVLGKANLFNLAHHTPALHAGWLALSRGNAAVAMGRRLRPRDDGQPGDAEELRLPVLRQELELVLRRHDRIHDLRSKRPRGTAAVCRRTRDRAAASPSIASPSCSKPAHR